MKVYIAARFSEQKNLQSIKRQLWALGYEVVATWIDEVAQPVGMPKGMFWKKLAVKDIAEIKSADLLILDTRRGNNRGGKEVEFGLALGAFQAKQIYLVGPVRNVFHTLADQSFLSWKQCLVHLNKMAHEVIQPNRPVA